MKATPYHTSLQYNPTTIDYIHWHRQEHRGFQKEKMQENWKWPS